MKLFQVLRTLLPNETIQNVELLNSSLITPAQGMCLLQAFFQVRSNVTVVLPCAGILMSLDACEIFLKRQFTNQLQFRPRLSLGGYSNPHSVNPPTSSGATGLTDMLWAPRWTFYKKIWYTQLNTARQGEIGYTCDPICEHPVDKIHTAQRDNITNIGWGYQGDLVAFYLVTSTDFSRLPL